VTWSIVLLVPFLLLAIAAALAVGLWLAPLNARYRDVGHTIPFLTQVWLYASPVAYPLSLVPEHWRTVYAMNPMVGVIEGFRWAVLGKAAPDLSAMWLGAVVVLVLLAGGVVNFRRMERSFADIV
jgi:lipopolysaccharide transport system permease protein